MMAWTNRHCRYLHRLFSPNALLFTEMTTAAAIIHGRRMRLLQFHPVEQPVACQLGGGDPDLLAQAAQAAAEAGFAEVNLNVGCPSPRVRRGRFGAALMAEPKLVAACIRAMREASDLPVTVKCRLGLDDQDTDQFLDAFIEAIAAAGCRTVYVHARKAILDGLNPAQNRTVPPLQPERVYALKTRFPQLSIIVNGGISTRHEAKAHLARTDGVMIGRAAWHGPRFLGELDAMMFASSPVDDLAAANAYLHYMAEQLAEGASFTALTRPMAGLFKGRPGVGLYRRKLFGTRMSRRDEPSAELATVRNAIAMVVPKPPPQARATTERTAALAFDPPTSPRPTPEKLGWAA